ncbi:MAG: T9SS type A sorting domain-containing protein [Bacteroidales bacterium]|nr:T9SS type A sorting domain-containing protein [Bacteroidales bacterium]
MKGFKSLLFFCALSSVVSAQTSFTLITSTGSSQHAIGETGGIYFADGNLTVKQSVGEQPSVNVPLADVRSIRFNGSSSISTPGESVYSAVVYPNPATDVIRVRFNGDGPQESVIYSVAGRRVIQTTLADGEAIDVSQLEKGLYVVRIGHSVTKFVKR